MVTSRDSKTTVSIDKILSDFAWKSYQKHMGRPRKYFVNRDKHYFVIHWDLLDFSHVTTMIGVDSDADLLDSFHLGTPDLDRSGSHTDSYVSAHSDVGAPMNLCSARFENTLDQPRSFLFSSEKDVPIHVFVELHEFYTVDGVTNIQLSLPMAMTPCEDDLKLSTTDPQKETVVKTLTWHIDRSVTVKASHTADINCLLHQKESTSEFEVRTTLSTTKGCFPVLIRRKSDDKIVFTCVIYNLEEVFRRHTRDISLVQTTSDVNSVVFTTRGRCKVISWRDEQIIVTSEPL